MLGVQRKIVLYVFDVCIFLDGGGVGVICSMDVEQSGNYEWYGVVNIKRNIISLV